eukprot:scaffold314466_cov15-Tisochrysis_lutea.AAC.1
MMVVIVCTPAPPCACTIWMSSVLAWLGSFQGRAKATTDQRLRGRGHMAKAEGIEGDLGAGLYRVGSGLDRSVRGGCMQ